MVRGASNLAMDLRACERVFQRIAHQLIGPRFLTVQFFGRRDPRGFDDTTKKCDLDAARCCARRYPGGCCDVMLYPFGDGQERRCGYWIMYVTGQKRDAGLPPSRITYRIGSSETHLYFLSHRTEEAELWELHLVTLKWMKIGSLSYDDVNHCDCFDATVTAEGVLRVGALWWPRGNDEDDEAFLLWDGDQPARRVTYDGTYGRPCTFRFVTPDVVLISTREGDVSERQKLLLYYVGLHGPPRVIASTRIPVAARPRYQISPCGHIVVFEPMSLVSPLRQVKLRY